jgi:hypothetical protein
VEVWGLGLFSLGSLSLPIYDVASKTAPVSYLLLLIHDLETSGCFCGYICVVEVPARMFDTALIEAAQNYADVRNAI